MGRYSNLLVAGLVGAAVFCPGSWVAHAQAAQVDATHQLVVDGEQLRVTTRWYEHRAEPELTFAVPLPADARVLGRGVSATRDPDTQALVGVRFDGPPPHPLVLELALPWAADDSLISLPLTLDAGWQRIEVEGEHRLALDLGAAVPMHTSGYYAPGDLRAYERLRIDRDLDGRHPAGAAYLPGDMLIEAGGVAGRLESGARRKLGLGVAAGGVFFTGLVVLVVVFRRQGSVVDVEEAEAYLDEEFRTLGDSDSAQLRP